MRRKRTGLFYGKHIEAYTCPFIISVSAAGHLYSALPPAEFAKYIDILHICPHAMEYIAFILERKHQLFKLFIILPQHHDIKVIIPWYEAFMPGCSQKSSGTEPPLYTILSAYVRNKAQHIQQSKLISS